MAVRELTNGGELLSHEGVGQTPVPRPPVGQRDSVGHAGRNTVETRASIEIRCPSKSRDSAGQSVCPTSHTPLGVGQWDTEASRDGTFADGEALNVVSLASRRLDQSSVDRLGGGGHRISGGPRLDRRLSLNFFACSSEKRVFRIARQPVPLRRIFL